MNFLSSKEDRKWSFITDQHRPPLNPLTLSFTTSELNRWYEKQATLRSLSYVRISLVLAISLYIFFAWLDPLVIPAVIFELMIIRVTSILFFGGVIYLTYTDWGTRNFQFLTSMTVIFAGLGLIAMTLISDSSGGYHLYAGLILTIMYAHGLLRMRFIYATLTTWFVILVYISATIVLGVTPFEIYINNLFFLVSANIMGMFASYWLEYYMKAVFWNERILSLKNRELKAEHDRKSSELEAARKMQMNMLPQRSPYLPDYQFSFSMKAASEVGGDYYDFNISSENHLTFGIGDATGHGLQASVMVTATKLLFSEYAATSDIVEFLKRASRSISLMGFRKIYMAFAIGRLLDNKLELAGAGMPPALIYRSRTKMVEEVPLKGMPLGSQTSYPYKKTMVPIEQDDVVLLMTDGLPELFNKKGMMIGYQHVKEIFAESGHLDPDQIIEHFQAISESWLDGVAANDDMTFFILKRKRHVLFPVSKETLINGSTEEMDYSKQEDVVRTQ